MTTVIENLLERMRVLEEELQAEFENKRKEIAFTIARKRIEFPAELLGRHRLDRVGLWQYLRESRLLCVLTAPIIYAGFPVFALLDLFVTVYSRTCFPVYGIAPVRRSDYLVFDRSELPYLNAVEKFNCFYCSYGNGVAAYLREVAARTEQYWCPIKHARRLLDAHDRYPHFFEFGDSQAYRAGLEHLRKQQSGRPAASCDANPPPPADRT